MDNKSNNSNNNIDTLEERKKKRKIESDNKKLLQNRIIDQFRLYYKNMTQNLSITNWITTKERKNCDLIKEHGHVGVEEFEIKFKCSMRITATNLKDEQEYTEDHIKEVHRIIHPKGSSPINEQMITNFALLETEEQKYILFQRLINRATNDQDKSVEQEEDTNNIEQENKNVE